MDVSERYRSEDQDDYERVDCGDLYVEEVVQVEDGERDPQYLTSSLHETTTFIKI